METANTRQDNHTCDVKPSNVRAVAKTCLHGEEFEVHSLGLSDVEMHFSITQLITLHEF